VLGNAVGLIDADYEGPCLISAWNRNPASAHRADEAILIQPGDRIAQLVFTRIVQPDFTVVAEFSATGNRQEGGFGSTGTAAADANACPDPAAGRNYPEREDTAARKS